MARRYLVTSPNADFKKRFLQDESTHDLCRTVDDGGHADVDSQGAESWQELLARLPAGWHPEFVVATDLAAPIPNPILQTPMALVGLAFDRAAHWHVVRSRARQCDLVLAESGAAEALRAEGVESVYDVPLFDMRMPPAGKETVGFRDIDVLFVGAARTTEERRELNWLAAHIPEPDRWRAAVHPLSASFPLERIACRARIAFFMDAADQHPFEAMVALHAGAVVFQRNSAESSAPDVETGVVRYQPESLQAQLDFYLSQEAERLRLVRAGREYARAFRGERLWRQILRLINQRLPDTTRPRRQAAGVSHRLWHVLHAKSPELIAANECRARSMLVTNPESPELLHALGVYRMLQPASGSENDILRPLAQAWSISRHPIAGLNFAEALGQFGDNQQAEAQASQVLSRIAAGWMPGDVEHETNYPPRDDDLRNAWDNAARCNAGDKVAEANAKELLVRWRLHLLLSRWLEDTEHAYAATLARPDHADSYVVLAEALMQQGRLAEACTQLRTALTFNPIHSAASTLSEVLGRLGANDAKSTLVEARNAARRKMPHLIPPETWCAGTRPNDGLASILILCCNQLTFTKMCVESVIHHTRMPYELIFVDNGSVDGTSQYLQQLPTRAGPARVHVIRNEKNLGFPAGCNQAFAAAKGHYLLLLNNDTIVTAGWLEGLIAPALHDWPTVGLVGPVSNFASTPQSIPTDYNDIDGIDRFAAKRSSEFCDRVMEARRLTGFCLLLRREVLDSIGGFDERFGLGFFDDDDFCARARAAGFRLLLAMGVFVHHFGSRTFLGLGVDAYQQLEDNLAIYRDKWGEAETRAYRLPARPEKLEDTGSDSVPPATRRTARISLCVIARNEEKNLPECLEPVCALVDEVIVVDTGSTDATPQVANAAGARVVLDPWTDSFSRARNTALEHATGDWIFWLDADDRVDEVNLKKLAVLFARLGDDNACFLMQCISGSAPDEMPADTAVAHVRLFRRHPAIRWRYRVHEQILHAVRALGGAVRNSDVVIQHVGYKDAGIRQRKLDRNLRLLLQDLQEHPKDPYVLFNLGWTSLQLDRFDEAITLLRESLAYAPPGMSIVPKLYSLLANAYTQSRCPKEALEICTEGRRRFPEDLELLFWEGGLRMQAEDFKEAEECFHAILRAPKTIPFTGLDTGVRTYKTRHNLAVLYRRQRRFSEAESLWREALDQSPDFAQSWLGLGELYIQQRRWGDLEKVLQALKNQNARAPELVILRARADAGRGHFDEAKRVLREEIRRNPASAQPRIAYSQVLLQENRDLPGAAQALRDVLALDPQHRDSQRNLKRLMERLGTLTPAVSDQPA